MVQDNGGTNFDGFNWLQIKQTKEHSRECTIKLSEDDHSK